MALVNIGATANDGTGDKLRTAFGIVNEGLLPSNARLKEIVSAEGYELTVITYDSDGVVTTATALWPDGSAGTFTTVTKNTTFLTVDGFTITHADSAKTVTQPTVTRDSLGRITTKPPLTVT